MSSALTDTPAASPAEPTVSDATTTTPETSHPTDQAAPESPAEQGQPAEGEATDTGEGEQGPYTITVPEGMVLNESLMKAVTPIFQEMGLSQEQAQTLADAYSQVELEREKHAEREQLEQIATWQEEVKADPDLGGAKFTERLGVANQALKQFGNEALTQILDETGLGNNKEVIRAFYKIGKQLGEGQMATGQSPGDQGKSPLENRLYPSMPK